MRYLLTGTCLVVACLLQQAGNAQTGTIEIISSSEEAIVIVDSVRLGTVADRYFSVVPDTHRVSLVRNTEFWNAAQVTSIAVVSEEDTSQVSLELPKRYRIETLPIGAELTWQRADGLSEQLGAAPVVIDLAEAPAGRITATLAGYRQASVDARTLVEGESTLITLTPAHPQPAQEALLPTARDNQTRRLIDYGLVAGAVAAAALAVHFKFQANDLDDQYRDPGSDKFGNETTLQRIERFDTYSAIALGASTAALGVLSIRFIIR